MNYLLLICQLIIQVSLVIAIPLRAQISGHSTELDAAYDFVIVGGGLSGLTVADRLTENAASESRISRLK
jgi:ribulose 1,5-bisphosphate synthetase/thiazole synthase